MRSTIIAFLVELAWASGAIGLAPISAASSTDLPRLFDGLAVSRTHIAFAHAGDIWVLPRAGGSAIRLTSGPEDDTSPSFSSDGTRIAFSRSVEGDADVYVVGSGGGSPTRLTFHPSAEIVRGWSPDGADILFTAARSRSRQPRLHTVPAAGGPTRVLPIPIAWTGVFAPDGRVVYAPQDVPGRYAQSWRGYRGGSMATLQIADLRNGSFTLLSSGQGNDRFPAWAGELLLVSSDRADGIYNIYRMDPASGRATPLTHFADFGIGGLAGSPDGKAAYEHDGRIFLLDLSTGRSERVPISLEASSGETADRQVPAGDFVSSIAVGAGGAVAIAARGDILLVDASTGGRNVTASSLATDDAPAFSPDGRRVAYVSFGRGGDKLVLQDLGRAGQRRTISLPSGRGGYYEPAWSPDARRVTLTDNRGGLWLADVSAGTIRRLDSATHMNDASFSAAWSPDSRWIAYSRHLPNNNRALFLQSAAGGPTYQLTSGEVDAGAPAFGRDGRHLYFVASGNAAASEAFGMYPVILGPLTLRRIYGAEIDLSQSPERLREAVDSVAFEQRVAALPFPPRDYGTLSTLADGTFVASARLWPPTPGGARPGNSLFRLDPTAPDSEAIASMVDRFAVSPDGSWLLTASAGTWALRPLSGVIGGRTFTLNGVNLTVHPPQEWQQIYREAWRAVRDTFYDPGHHGQDVSRLERHYAAYLPGISRRADLTTLLYVALGNVSVSHIQLDGGDIAARPSRPPPAGLLGADFEIESGRFRFSRIYPDAPFGESGISGPLNHLDPPVHAGDYLIQVNGVDVTPDRDVHSYLVGSANRPTTLTIASRVDGAGSRTVNVRPLANDAALREAAWIESNRGIVASRSNGTIGYIYIPDFQERGIAAFVRQWTAASDMDGVVIDQRDNGGGWAADFILDFVQHRPLAYYMFRDARDLPFPVIGNAGPKVLIVNERNGSAAETFAWMFQHSRVGPLVGRQTAGWGIGHVWRLILPDGGGLSLPLRAFFNPEGTWDIENRGVVPDLSVALDPAGALRGEDSQLNAAVDLLLQMRREHPTSVPQHPERFRYPPAEAASR